MTTQRATLACPICEYECAAWEDVRFHLHTRHPKSELVDALVVTEASIDRRESSDVERESVDTSEEFVDVDALIAR